MLTVLGPDTEVAMIAVQDIGFTAAAAVADPARFAGVELELASDVRTMRQLFG